MVEKNKASDNFKHYVNALMTGNSYFSGELIYKYSLYVFGFIHVILSILMLICQSYKLMIANIVVCIVIYTIAPKLVKKGLLLSVLLGGISEVILMTTASILTIGWEAGFQCFLFSAITGAFYFPFIIKGSKRNILSLALSVLLIVAFFFNYLLSSMLNPFEPLSEGLTTLLFVINSLAALALMVGFSFLFVWELLSKQRILELQNEQLDELAHKDPLTHLYNRRSMNKKMDERMLELKKTGKRFTLVLGDIDDFKHVNDTFGHDAGDMVLTSVAEIISRNVGSQDVVCRWGGEEILIMMNDSLESGLLTVEKIRKAVEEHVCESETGDVKVTMTFGAAESIPGYTIEHLIQQSDDKLYYGKRNGKNQVVSKLPEDYVPNRT